MFGRKKIKSLEAQNNHLKKVIEELNKSNIKALHTLESYSKSIKRIEDKIDPAPVTIYTLGVEEVLSRIKRKYKPIKKCGPGGCGLMYVLPIHEIESPLLIIKQQKEEESKETN